MEQSSRLDNQQERLEDRLNWLGGIIDGEGWITATAGHTKTGRGYKYDHRRYIPQIGIVSTDKSIVDNVLTILEEAGIPCYVASRKGNKRNPHWKHKTEIKIMGMKRCLNAAPKLIPYLRSDKRRKLETLKTWIEYRMCQPGTPFAESNVYGGSKRPYDDEDYRLLNLIRESSIIPRDYTSSSDNKSDEDIVQPPAKAVGM